MVLGETNVLQHSPTKNIAPISGNARKNLLLKLAGSKWCEKLQVVKTSVQALCFSTGKYASPVWCIRIHSQLLDVALNQTWRLVNGYMKAATIDKLYARGKKNMQKNVEKFKEAFGKRHVLHGRVQLERRLKPRKGFLHCAPLDTFHLQEFIQQESTWTGKP